jgi:hypothetical protein
MRNLMFHNEQSLIAKKMILEAKWNHMFLDYIVHAYACLVRWHAPKVAMPLTITSLRLGGRIRSPRMILCSAYSASQPVRTERNASGPLGQATDRHKVWVDGWIVGMGGWVDGRTPNGKP